MSRNGDIVQWLGDQDRTFRFGLAEHLRLQEKLDVGLSLIVQSLHPFVSAVGHKSKPTFGQILDAGRLGDLRIDRIGEVVFQGLVGAGVDPAEAGAIRKTWVDERPVTETALIAYRIGLAALIGAADEDAASGRAGGDTGSPSPTAKSGSEKTASTRSVRRRATPRKKSTA